MDGWHSNEYCYGGVMMAKYKKIEGEFVIQKNGNMFINDYLLESTDIVEVPVKVIRQIIKDAKDGVI